MSRHIFNCDRKYTTYNNRNDKSKFSNILEEYLSGIKEEYTQILEVNSDLFHVALKGPEIFDLNSGLNSSNKPKNYFSC